MLLQLSRLLDHEGYLAFLLLKNIHHRTAIHEAARRGHLFLLQLIFEIMENDQRLCEATDHDLKTSLHLAAAAGRQMLLTGMSDWFDLFRSRRDCPISSSSRSECLFG